ncbi:hypothetical protein KCV87_31585 [Actinosynnema pretiosum subsp. pretiosum]|uniref:Fibronectin type-III domain-containing protein n=1 Tax=Actinosynnema pretiosum subsp. pretiosum TaxID=103721 RepID=A0AA45R3H8_9PSEU|nr:ACT domain containing transcriptional regulators [Actinosynnema pretiosum subsp. pretiosum]QUF03856.1 hypothetical protein KCV87_31585 [Actinosynnema pretiosum subsp. pretiosum]
MTAWSFDATRFVDEVLKPVQDGWRPDEDLFRVYLLSTGVTERSTVETALAEIAKQFGKQQYRVFRRALEILRGQHAAASDVLLDPARRGAHRARVEAERNKLAATVKAWLNGAPGVPAKEVTTRARALKVPRSAILAALRENTADEREPVDLPAPAEPGQWSEARGHLAQLREESLWDYLGGLGGIATTESHLAARRGKLRVSRSSDSATETTLLRLVQGWLEQNALRDALGHELLGHVADRAAYGYAEALEAAESMAQRSCALGIAHGPSAVAYALWCRVRFTAEAEPVWWENYQRAVEELRLRTALTILEQQPALSEEWALRRTVLARQLAELDTELDRCQALERTDTEAAVAGYHRVREALTDDRVDAAIQRCRPSAPTTAKAVVGAGRVTVSWRPIASRAGRIAYRVSRGDTVLSGDTDAVELVDRAPPNGVPLVYEVRALRDGNPSSSAARTAPVTLLGDVLNAEASSGADSISGRWRLPEGAIGSQVTRSGAEVRDARPTSFTDHDVRPGQSYEYLVRARYRAPGGTNALSEGVLLAASCQEVPVAVTDLLVEFDRDDLVAKWTPPPRGEVELLELEAGEDLPDPGVVSVGRARKRGLPVRAAFTARGALRGRLSVQGKACVLVPVTVLGDLAAIGVAVPVDVRCEPVSALRLDRRGTTVQLTWEWPRGVSAARVVWREGVKPLGPLDPQASVLDVTRVGYDSRGVTVPFQGGDCWFGVCTARQEGGSTSFGPLVLRRETAAGTVRYSIRRAHPLTRRRTLTVEGDLPLPGLVLVGKSGIRPMGADDGVVLLRVENGEVVRDGEFEVPKDLRKPVHLRAFSLDEQVVLVARRPDELIVRGF